MKAGVALALSGLSVGVVFACGEPPLAAEPVSISLPRRAAPRGPDAPPLDEAPLAHVARLRGLRVLRDVEVELLGRDELMAAATREIERDFPEQVARGQSAFFVMLGLAPEGFDLRRALLDVMRLRLVGFYQPLTRRVLVAADQTPEDRAQALFHELGHALVDQHFALGAKVQYRPEAGDELAAIHALGEGDALSLMLDAEARHAGERAELEREYRERLRLMLDDAPPGVPPVLNRLMAAPYSDGLHFVTALRQRGGWAAVDDVWRLPPTTTEQILHPEKYATREPAEPVALPDAGSSGCSLVYSDVVGEQGVAAVLSQWHRDKTARAAASGWGGDRLAVYQCASGWRVGWRIRQDDEVAAHRAWRAFAHGLRAMQCLPGLEALGAEPPAVAELALEGRDVVVTLKPRSECR